MASSPPKSGNIPPEDVTKKSPNDSGSPPQTDNVNGANGKPASPKPNLTGLQNGTNGNGTVANGNGHRSGNGNGNGLLYHSNGHSPDQSRIEERNLHALKLLCVTVGTAIMPPKCQKGTLLEDEHELEVITNVYGLNHTRPLEVHSYHMTLAKLFGEREITFSGLRERKFRLPDYFMVQQRRFYQKTVPLFYLKYPVVFGDNTNNHLIDYANTMLSFNDFPANPPAMELSGDDINGVVECDGVKLKIQPANLDIMSHNLGIDSDDIAAWDASLTRYTEIATSHHVASNFDDFCMFNNSKAYFMSPVKFGYSPHDSPELGRKKFICIGAEKSIYVVEGGRHDEGHEELAAVFDSKKTPFYMVGALIDAVTQTLKLKADIPFTDAQRNLLRPLIKDLTVYRTYGNNKRPFSLNFLSTTNARDELVREGEYQGATIEDYFARRYSITLQYPNWPLVVMRRRRMNFCFPIELLYVADFQRVRNQNLFPDEISKLIKVSAVDPAQKLDEIRRSVEAFNINGSEYADNAGISVAPEPVKVTGRLLNTPQIQYLNGVVDPVDAKWRLPKAVKYVLSATCLKWLAVLLDHDHARAGDIDRLRAFNDNFIVECQTRGMNIAEPVDIFILPASDEKIDNTFCEAVKTKIDFILFVHPDDETVYHDRIKTFERKYMIVTQCVRSSTVEKVADGQTKLTLENIVAKTNVKLGGLNYIPTLTTFAIDPRALFIGLSVNHPGGGFKGASVDQRTEESYSILGFAANDGKNAHAFSGNFYLQPVLQDEQLTVIDRIIREVMERFVENRGHVPSRVVIYHSGNSQGRFAYMLRYEIPVILSMVKRFASNCPVSVIVPSKMHSVRLFKQNIDPTKRSDEQNIPAGLVVDSKIVHPKLTEFYLNSHVAIKGTAKTPKYTVLFTSEKATLDLFQRWTNCLCNSFQIVNSPVSIPAPAYIAQRYAERGRQIANNFALTKLQEDQHLEGLVIPEEEVPAEDLNEYASKSLKYNYTYRPPLRDRRINA